MNINSVQNAGQSAKIQQQTAAMMQKIEKSEAEAKDSQSAKVEQAAADKAELSVDSGKKNYTMDSAKVAELKAQFSQHASSFQAMISKMFEQQGITWNQSSGETLSELLSRITVDPATRAKAAESVSEKGYWGVEQTSARILDFAKAISGGDPSKIETLKKAFERGFGDAAKKFGNLPDISHKTYEAVMKGFDEWENSGKVEKSDKAEKSGEVKKSE